MFAGFNWIDWTIVAILLYYALQGWNAGFADLGLSFITFLLSLYLSIKFHAPVGDFLSRTFGIPSIWTGVLGYILVAFIAQAILSELVQFLLGKLPQQLVFSKVNKLLGTVVSIADGVVIIAFFLLVILALPLKGTIKMDVQQSTIGDYLVTIAQKYGGPITSTIDQARQEVTKFITVDPDSNENISLPITPSESELTVDTSDEEKMVSLVNQERVKARIEPVRVDRAMTAVAQAHARDMFLRHYFSHVNPEGLSAADRLEKAGVFFNVAGENIAYAPDLATAHEGLMNSPGHKANILDPSFHRIGIGIISTVTWGTMFVQDFAN
ncbi:MAG: CvpA family protein [Candidatus Gottesmanbacteria bacterium]|nr:CvpA family protein [Candidatus Gottesmanbacteria bacterium]